MQSDVKTGKIVDMHEAMLTTPIASDPVHQLSPHPLIPFLSGSRSATYISPSIANTWCVPCALVQLYNCTWYSVLYAYSYLSLSMFIRIVVLIRIHGNPISNVRDSLYIRWTQWFHIPPSSSHTHSRRVPAILWYDSYSSRSAGTIVTVWHVHVCISILELYPDWNISK